MGTMWGFKFDRIDDQACQRRVTRLEEALEVQKLTKPVIDVHKLGISTIIWIAIPFSDRPKTVSEEKNDGLGRNVAETAMSVFGDPTYVRHGSEFPRFSDGPYRSPKTIGAPTAG